MTQPTDEQLRHIPVLRAHELDGDALASLLARFGIRVQQVEEGGSIPGSYWGDSEAGLLGDAVYWRADTPLHSILHEASHYVCMDARRRAQLARDAGGEYEEENAVCYLQILLADYVPESGRARMFADMDAWGYTFRLGSSRAWFEHDAQDARAWLVASGVIDDAGGLTWRCRE